MTAEFLGQFGPVGVVEGSFGPGGVGGGVGVAYGLAQVPDVCGEPVVWGGPANQDCQCFPQGHSQVVWYWQRPSMRRRAWCSG